MTPPETVAGDTFAFYIIAAGAQNTHIAASQVTLSDLTALAVT